MSFFDSASLVQIPSGVKDGVLYSVKPIDGSGDLTFSRGSDIEATRVNANGYIEKAQVNLLLQSNQFDTTWVTSVASVTGGQADKDGGSTAWLLSKTASFGRVEQSITLAGVYSFSVYAKAGTSNWIAIGANASLVTSGAFFDLGTGAVGSKGSNVVYSKITALSGGWYRCEAVINNPTENYFRVYVADANGDVIGISGNIYIQDAQLNYGLVAQDYQETTTAAVVSGITDNMPRLNYDPANPTCPSLLLEPSRQNLFSYSEYINGLSTIQATITDNAETSPEGVVNAARVYDNTSNAQHRVGDNAISVTSGTTYTFSVFAKKGTLRYCYLLSTASGSTERWFFDLQEGTAITSGGTIEDYGNGWYRLSIQVTASATGSAVFGLNLTNDSQDNIYAGTGTDYHIIYGFQCEAGSYESSYIPCHGSSATRTAETSIQALAAGIFTSTEGAWFFQVKDMKFDITGTGIGSMDLSVSNNLNTSIEVVQDGNDMFKITLDGSTAVQDLDGEKKVAITWGSFGLKIYVDGAQAYTTANTTYSRQYNYFSLSRPTREWSGLMKQLIFFPSSLSDTELATLTTI